MKPCKAILVGNGTMGGRHRTRFEACGVRFVAVADNRDEFDGVVDKLTKSAKGFALPEIDFAVIASPASTHYAYAKFFLERRVPVFVEKPLAVAGEEAQELVNLAAKNDTLLFVAQSECYNPLFLNFRKHFLAELNGRSGALLDAGNKLPADDKRSSSDKLPAGIVRLEFRREHRRSERCRDVNVALDLLVHDLSLFLTLFKTQDVDVEWFKVGQKSAQVPADFDSAMLRLRVARGQYCGVIADFYVNRNSDRDIRTVSVDFPGTNYTVSLARYGNDGEIAHVPDSLENEHRFFLKLLAGACLEWGKRAAQSAADCVKLATALWV